MKHIARTLALALLGVGLSQAAENSPPAPKIPLEARVKEAAKPYAWNQIDFMSAPKGKRMPTKRWSGTGRRSTTNWRAAES